MMKKTVLVVAATLLLGACIPSNFVPTQQQPNVDFAATANANLQTYVAQTLTAQATPTVAPVTDTPTPTAVLFEASPTETATDLSATDLTTTPATATSGAPVT